jgi:hypothetical protein
MTNHEDPMEVVRDLRGCRVTRIRRIHFRFRGIVDLDRGAIEISAGEFTVVLDAAANGQNLLAVRGPWLGDSATDTASSAKELDPIGTFAVLDETDSPEYAGVSGHPIISIRPMIRYHGATIVGMVSCCRPTHAISWPG